LIEAMAMEKAVVATDAGGVPEVVVHGETGLLVPPGQPKEMADAVVDIVKDPARAARLGKAGRKRVEAEFDITKDVHAIEAIYVEVLGFA
jgi:starch synthase